MNWIALENPQELPSPDLFVVPSRIQDNIQQMLATVGGADYVGRLRPHVKTHKMAEVVVMQIAAGITKFKVATLSEAEMTAAAGATDVLVAHQPVGPKIDQLSRLIKNFPDTAFSAIVDNQYSVNQLASTIGSESRPLRLWIDIDCGMGRTGIDFGEHFDALHRAIGANPLTTLAGLHVYDGHIHDALLAVRTKKVRSIIQSLRRHIADHEVQSIVSGGTPTFGIWAFETPWECSPGTLLLWDVGCENAFTEMPYQLAAALVTRVVSKPSTGRLCLDLGHKAVASEMPLADRVVLPQLPRATFLFHNEEHLVVGSARADEFTVGDVLLAYPKHICPTVALYDSVAVVREDRVTKERWEVTSRGRQLSV
ncbi:D-TA family PLP-dependent enzyme [Pirellulales bacterium]|nr:D-TA family PLP-dependent enzyme [Pirellulales bacterium]